MNPSFYEISTWFRWREGDDTILATVTFHLVTDNLTDIFDFIEFQGFRRLIIDIDEKVVRVRLLFNYIETLTKLHCFDVLLMEIIQFIKWHGKDTTVHEHM